MEPSLSAVLHRVPLLLPLLPRPPPHHAPLPRLPPLRRELQVELCGRGRLGAAAVAPHHLPAAHLVLLGRLRRPHRLLVGGQGRARRHLPQHHRQEGHEQRTGMYGMQENHACKLKDFIG